MADDKADAVLLDSYKFSLEKGGVFGNKKDAEQYIFTSVPKMVLIAGDHLVNLMIDPNLGV